MFGKCSTCSGNIVAALAKKKSGLTRKEVIDQSRVSAGGAYGRAITDLVQSDFIAEFIPFGKKKRGVMYRLQDEFSIFYHRFMRPNRKFTKGMWSQLSAGQRYRTWTGYAFENLCLSHVTELKKAIGIAAVYTETSSLRVEGNGGEKGFQIDLLIDMNDNTINLCEIKYHGASFRIDRKYARELVERRQRFIDRTGTRKQVFNTFISNHSLFDNDHAREVIDVELTLEELF